MENQNNMEEPSEWTNAEQMLKERQQLFRSGGGCGEVRVAATLGLKTAKCVRISYSRESAILET